MNAYISDPKADLHAIFTHVDGLMKNDMAASKLQGYGYTPEMHARFSERFQDPHAIGLRKILTVVKRFYSHEITALEVERGNVHMAKAEMEKRGCLSQRFDTSAFQSAQEADSKLTYVRTSLDAHTKIRDKIDRFLSPTPASNVIALTPRPRRR